MTARCDRSCMVKKETSQVSLSLRVVGVLFFLLPLLYRARSRFVNVSKKLGSRFSLRPSTFTIGLGNNT